MSGFLEIAPHRVFNIKSQVRPGFSVEILRSGDKLTGRYLGIAKVNYHIYPPYQTKVVCLKEWLECPHCALRTGKIKSDYFNVSFMFGGIFIDKIPETSYSEKLSKAISYGLCFNRFYKNPYMPSSYNMKNHYPAMLLSQSEHRLNALVTEYNELIENL